MQVAPLDVATQPGRPRQRRFALQSSDGMVSFKTEPFTKRTEFTGHVTANLHVCIPAGQTGSTPSDIDLFVTIRHLDEAEKEIFYTGTAGDPVPVTKGWLRCSLRKVDTAHAYHRDYLPYRSYASTSVEQGHALLLASFEDASCTYAMWKLEVSKKSPSICYLSRLSHIGTPNQDIRRRAVQGRLL